MLMCGMCNKVGGWVVVSPGAGISDLQREDMAVCVRD